MVGRPNGLDVSEIQSVLFPRLLSADQFLLLARLVFDDISRDRAGRDSIRRRQIHLTRAAASREIAVLSADHDLVRTRGNARACVDAGSATGLDHLRARLAEDIQISAANAVVASFLRAELDEELDRVCDPLALLQSVSKHGRVHIHVFILASGAGAPVRNLDGDWRIEFTNILAIARIARRCHHRRDFGSVEFDHMRILGARIAIQPFDHRFRFLAIDAAALHQKVDRLFVRRHDAREPTNLRSHVGHGGALIDAEFLDRLACILHHLGERLAAAYVIQAENL